MYTEPAVCDKQEKLSGIQDPTVSFSNCVTRGTERPAVFTVRQEKWIQVMNRKSDMTADSQAS